MTTKTLASSLAALAMFAAQGAAEPVWSPDARTANQTIYNAVGFENFALGATPTTSYDDSGTADSSKAYFLYSGTSGDDQSIVTNYPIGFFHSERPAYFTNYDEGQYLSLSTEGGTLFRSLNVIDTSGETPALGTAEEIPAATGLFVDTLVQFTPCEEAPAFNDGDLNKLAIWLNVVTNGAGDAVGTNLCVRAGYWDYQNEILAKVAGGATYTLANTSEISVQAGEWVRLTVKAIQNVYSSSTVGEMPAFQVYINDTLAVFNEDVASSAALAQIGTLEAAAQTALAEKTILPSMQDAAALQAVGFQGTGAVDDFVVTTENPYAVPVDFTLYWDANILALETFLEGDAEPTVLTDAGLNHVFDNMGDGDTLEIDIPDDGVATSVASGYEIDWANTVLTNVTMEAIYEDDEDPTTLYGYLFTLDGDGPYSVTLVTKSSTPAQDFDGGSGTLGDPYIVGTAKSFNELVTKVAAGDTFAGKFFQLSGDVDFNALGITAFAGIGEYNSATAFFAGTFDGQGYKLMNVDLSPRSYAGVFNQVKGGTIKNLTVSNITCSTYSSGNWSCSIVGTAASGTTLQNLVAEGDLGTEAAPCTHNAAGIAIRADIEANSSVSFIDCTNNASIVTRYTKVAGILGISQAQAGTTLTLTRCVNNGSVKKLDGSNGDGGVAGIVAYLSGVGSSAGDVVFDSCESLGSVTTTADPYYQLGTMIGYNSGRPITLQGTNIARADTQSVGQNTGGTANSVVGDLAFATVGNNVATFVAPTFGDTVYYCMAANSKAFVLTNAADELSIDTSLSQYTGTVTTTVEGGEVATETSRTVTTYYVDTGSSGKTVSPGGFTELEASTAEAATNEAESVEIVVTDTAAKNADQIYVLTKEVVYDEATGKYGVVVVINEKARNFVKPDEAVAVVAGVLSGSAASVTVSADKLTPGLYYSLAVATEVDGTYTEGLRTLATGSADIQFSISKPEGTKAFYKVLVNMLPVSAQ